MKKLLAALAITGLATSAYLYIQTKETKLDAPAETLILEKDKVVTNTENATKDTAAAIAAEKTPTDEIVSAEKIVESPEKEEMAMLDEEITTEKMAKAPTIEEIEAVEEIAAVDEEMKKSAEKAPTEAKETAITTPPAEMKEKTEVEKETKKPDKKVTETTKKEKKGVMLNPEIKTHLDDANATVAMLKADVKGLKEKYKAAPRHSEERRTIRKHLDELDKKIKRLEKSVDNVDDMWQRGGCHSCR